MPLTLNVGLSRKVADNQYGSRGASINVEVEVESALVGDPVKLKDRIRQIFGMVRDSLAAELDGAGNGSPPDRHDADRKATNGAANGSSKGAGPRPASQSQVKAIFAITREQGLNVGQFLRERFNVGKPESLTIRQASDAIDELKKQE